MKVTIHVYVDDVCMSIHDYVPSMDVDVLANLAVLAAVKDDRLHEFEEHMEARLTPADAQDPECHCGWHEAGIGCCAEVGE